MSETLGDVQTKTLTINNPEDKLLKDDAETLGDTGPCSSRATGQNAG